MDLANSSHIYSVFFGFFFRLESSTFWGVQPKGARFSQFWSLCPKTIFSPKTGEGAGGGGHESKKKVTGPFVEPPKILENGEVQRVLALYKNGNRPERGHILPLFDFPLDKHKNSGGGKSLP